MTIRKFAVAAVAVAALTTVVAAPAADDSTAGQGIGAQGWTPIQVGIFAPVSIPWDNYWDVKGFDLNLFYMETVKLQGVAISGVATRTKDEVRGVVVTGLCNWNEKDFYGINLTLGVNLAFEDVYGVQGGLFGMRRFMGGFDANFLGAHQANFSGVQCAGLCNFTLDTFKGAEISLGLNMAKTVKGAQLGGINFTHELTGTQIGFFNITEECQSGIQLGLINIILDNKVKILPITNFYFDF